MSPRPVMAGNARENSEQAPEQACPECGRTCEQYLVQTPCGAVLICEDCGARYSPPMTPAGASS
jgi:hypothetical protein